MKLLLLATLLFWNGEKITHTDEEWRSLLGRDRYCVMRKKATEPAFSGKYFSFEEEGVYLCAACQRVLFQSSEKIQIGHGWPSFSEPISPLQVWIKEDLSLPFRRYEVLCRSCDSHLGHVFREKKEGPLRYTINSIALEFIPNIKKNSQFGGVKASNCKFFLLFGITSKQMQ